MYKGLFLVTVSISVGIGLTVLGKDKLRNIVGEIKQELNIEKILNRNGYYRISQGGGGMLDGRNVSKDSSTTQETDPKSNLDNARESLTDEGIDDEGSGDEEEGSGDEEEGSDDEEDDNCSSSTYDSLRDCDVKMVLVSRADLNMSPGKSCAQSAHAAVGAASAAKKLKPKIFKYWTVVGSKKIVVRAKNLVEIEEIEKTAKSLGLATHRVIDAGYTEVPPNTLTFIGVGPDKGDLINKVTGNLPLL